jgi:hypothetical protein
MLFICHFIVKGNEGIHRNFTDPLAVYFLPGSPSVSILPKLVSNASGSLQNGSVHTLRRIHREGNCLRVPLYGRGFPHHAVRGESLLLKRTRTPGRWSFAVLRIKAQMGWERA